MSAAIAVHTPQEIQRHEVSETPAQVTESSELGFGATQLRAVALGMLVVFTVVVAVIYAYIDQFWSAVGIGLYLSMWLGGGFGFLMGGIAWGLKQEEHD